MDSEYKIVFDKDFRTRSGDTSLDSFDEIEGIPFTGAQRIADGFGMALPENRFLLRTPALGNFRMHCTMAKGPDPRNAFRFYLYFHYDDRTHVSGVLELSAQDDNWTVRAGVLKDHKAAFANPAVTWSAGDCLNWTLEIRDSLCVFDNHTFEIPEGVPETGRIGFNHLLCDSIFEFTCIQKLQVLAEPVEYQELFAKHTWEIPRYVFDSMSSWRFSMEAAAAENTILLHTALEGGPVEVPDYGHFYTYHQGNEYLENPYFQIVHPDGTTGEKQYLYYGKIGFHEHWLSLQSAFPAADVECPVRQDFYLNEAELPAGSRLIIGFEKMRSEDRQHLSECGREIIVDPFSGKLLESRKMDHGDFHIAVDSGADKEICRIIPETVTDYEKALCFARHNHFFFDGEDCAFEITAGLPSDLCTPKEVSLHITLEDVFKEPLDRVFECKDGKTQPSFFPNTRTVGKFCNFGKLPCGVYHIRTALKMNGEDLAVEQTAFEVMSREEKSLSAPELSGLPLVFSAQDDFESAANPFDPRGEGSGNAAHYIAVSGLQVFFVEQKREWELLKLYKRRLFSWFLVRSAKNPDVLQHLETAKNSEYVAGEDFFWRFHANDLDSYNEKNRRILAQFLTEKGNPSMAAEALDMSRKLSLEYVEKILSAYGNEWPAYVAARRVPERDALITKWTEAGINPDTLCNYSFAPYYVTHTGVAFTALRYGRDLRHPEHPDYSAFSLAEEYPQLCSYPMICGCFTIANIKLDMPDLNLWPEIYGIAGIPLDYATIANHLPDGAQASEIFSKRFYDPKTRACWFRDGQFHFWNDDGFHVRNPSEADLNQMLESWKHIRQWNPVKPLRSMAFVGGAECILKHKPVAEIKQFPGNGDFLDFYNTAEDFPAFVYLSSRFCGLPNGFAVRGCEIASLKPEDVSTLVLPPMDCFTAEEKLAIRKLYESGVHLFCSECADGLEDLFGVKPCEAHPVLQIGNEKTNARFNPVRWEPLPDTEVLLRDQDGVPLLTLKRGQNGAYAVLFTFAPTAFLRMKVTASEASSRILADAIDKVCRRLESDTAEVLISKGRINAFRDRSGDLIVVAAEDAQPLPRHAITPLLTVKGDWRNCQIESDVHYSIVSRTAEKMEIRFRLEPDEARFFRFRK